MAMTTAHPTARDGDPAPDQALLALGRYLQQQAYHFVTITPETHKRILARNHRLGIDLRDVFGWNRWFDPGLLPGLPVQLLEHAGCLERSEGRARSRIRFSTFGEQIYLHSAFPTTQADAVFFGPDTYRFIRVVRALTGMLSCRPRCAVEIGCGSGAAGLAIASSCEQVILADINHSAIRFAAINAVLNQVGNCTQRYSDILQSVTEPVDLIIANPPYLVDPAARVYRDGGGRAGTGLAVRIVRESLEKLSRGGRLILYTGTPVERGIHVLWQEIAPLLARVRGDISYEEVDPDVFGEELDGTAYQSFERLAVVALAITLQEPVERSR